LYHLPASPDTHFGGIAADLNGNTLDPSSHPIPSFLILGKRKRPVSRSFSTICLLCQFSDLFQNPFL
jgi:hypothetical protein